MTRARKLASSGSGADRSRSWGLESADWDAHLDALGADPSDVAQRLFDARVLGGLFGGAVDVRVGRYMVAEEIGRGASGVVYAGHDPELLRPVAVKVIEVAAPQRRRRERILDEARALGALSHPNVVGVFDVGVSGDSPYVVMELVEGEDLTTWLAEPHTRDETLAMFIEIGRGLEAVHAMGLVHRDVKPANVRLGTDGRPRLLDFGLARRASTDEPSPGAAVVVGTPGYMAPEQRRGAEPTAPADQYSFCVSLHEALHGTRPERDSDGSGVVAPGLPRRLRRVLSRGLARDPKGRYPTMGDLLRGLQRASRASMARRWAAVVGVSAVGSLLANGVSAEPTACAPDRLDDVWNAARREALRAAFVGTNVGHAPETWARVEPRLDAFTDSWRDAYAAACRAERADPARDARMACLATRLRDFSATLDVFEGSTSVTVAHAVEAAQAVRSPADCEEPGGAPVPPSDPAAVRILTALADARAAAAAGSYPDAIAKFEALEAALAPLECVPEVADARRFHADALERQTRLSDAMRVYEQAYYAGLRCGDDDQALRVAARLTRFADEDWLRHAVAARARLGPSAELDALLLRSQSRRTLYRDISSSYALAQQARRRMLEVEDPDPIEFAATLAAVGDAAREQTRYAEAVEAYEQVPLLLESALGPEHPDVLVARLLRADVLSLAGRDDEALAEYERALQRMRAAPDDHLAALAHCHQSMSTRLAVKGKFDAAIDHARESLALHQQLGTIVHVAMIHLGEILGQAGRHEEAVEWIERGRAELGPDDRHNWVVSSVQLTLGLQELGRVDEALEAAQDAVRIATLDAGRSDSRLLLVALNTLASAQSGVGHHLAALQTARQVVEGAKALFPPGDGSIADMRANVCINAAEAADANVGNWAVARAECDEAIAALRPHQSRDTLARVLFVMAQVLDHDAATRSRARALALEAREFYGTWEAGADDIAAIDSWLHERS